MASNKAVITLKVNLKLSFWQAFKMRLAGIPRIKNLTTIQELIKLDREKGKR